MPTVERPEEVEKYVEDEDGVDGPVEPKAPRGRVCRDEETDLVRGHDRRVKEGQHRNKIPVDDRVHVVVDRGFAREAVAVMEALFHLHLLVHLGVHRWSDPWSRVGHWLGTSYLLSQRS